MTTFWRDGFWRMSVYGDRHWVEGHLVDRSIWDRASSGSENSNFSALLRDARAGRSVAATFVVPNSDCPVCGVPTFFYQNAFGSRVYFDDLGPPWPKHPCTDNRQHSFVSSGETSVMSATPKLRDPSDIKLIQQWLTDAAYKPDWDFFAKHKLSPWTAFRVEIRIGRRGGTLLVLQRLLDDKPNRCYLRAKSISASLSVGSLAFYHRGWISFFKPESAKIHELEVERLTSAAQFVEALAELSPISGDRASH